MHSGNYGNWLPDANVRLTQLISSMFTPAGKVAIEGFYDDVMPLPAAAVQMMKEVPDVNAAMQQAVRGWLDGRAASSLQEGLNLPAFSVHMMKGGEVGGVIAASATAEIALRLVKENSPRDDGGSRRSRTSASRAISSSTRIRIPRHWRRIRESQR